MMSEPDYFNCFGVFKTYAGAIKEAKAIISSWDPSYEILDDDETHYGYFNANNEFEQVGEICIVSMKIQE